MGDISWATLSLDPAFRYRHEILLLHRFRRLFAKLIPKDHPGHWHISSTYESGSDTGVIEPVPICEMYQLLTDLIKTANEKLLYRQKNKTTKPRWKPLSDAFVIDY
jgi:hypothetical protein